MADLLSNSIETAARVIGRPFAKGTSGNPGGRPLGSRNRINADFLRELSDHFAVEGRSAIERMCMDDPAAYVKVVASLLPKDVAITARPFSQFSDDDLLTALEMIQRHIVADGPAPVGTTIEGKAVALLTPDERT